MWFNVVVSIMLLFTNNICSGQERKGSWICQCLLFLSIERYSPVLDGKIWIWTWINSEEYQSVGRAIQFPLVDEDRQQIVTTTKRSFIASSLTTVCTIVKTLDLFARLLSLRSKFLITGWTTCWVEKVLFSVSQRLYFFLIWFITIH